MTLDNVCLESLSIDMTRPMLDSAARSVTRLGEHIEEYVIYPESATVIFLTYVSG